MSIQMLKFLQNLFGYFFCSLFLFVFLWMVLSWGVLFFIKRKRIKLRDKLSQSTLYNMGKHLIESFKEVCILLFNSDKKIMQKKYDEYLILKNMWIATTLCWMISILFVPWIIIYILLNTREENIQQQKIINQYFQDLMSDMKHDHNQIQKNENTKTLQSLSRSELPGNSITTYDVVDNKQISLYRNKDNKQFITTQTIKDKSSVINNFMNEDTNFKIDLDIMESDLSAIDSEVGLVSNRPPILTANAKIKDIFNTSTNDYNSKLVDNIKNLLSKNEEEKIQIKAQNKKCIDNIIDISNKKWNIRPIIKKKENKKKKKE